MHNDIRKAKTFTEAWRYGEIDALKIGLDYEYYWGKITPAIFAKYCEAYNDRLAEKQKMLDVANWQLGAYVRLAICDAFKQKNASSVYPKHPFSEQQKSTLKRKFTDAETRAFIKKGEC